MAVDDYLEPEVGVAAAVAAAVFSPQVRGLLHKGLVYATAGVLIAGDAVTSFARGVGQGVEEVKTSVETKAQNVETGGETQERPARRRAATKPHNAPEKPGGEGG